MSEVSRAVLITGCSSGIGKATAAGIGVFAVTFAACTLLAGVSLDGTRFFYTNTLRQLDRMPVPLRWSRRREEWISCYCCPPNVARTIADLEADHGPIGAPDGEG